MSDNWDVDAYKSEFENEEHWELKKNFMLAHKDKFPEDELVCLAQVFANIEFLGCRYPDKTMIRVAELAKGVVEKFRENRKNSLKRTFVAASDAASAKVKAANLSWWKYFGGSGVIGEIWKRQQPFSPKKTKIMGQTDNEVQIVEEKVNKVKAPNKRPPRYGGVKTFNIKQDSKIEKYPLSDDSEGTVNTDDDLVVGNPDDPLKNFVLILQKGDENPISIMHRNAVINKCKLRWHFDQSRNQTYTCNLYINGNWIASSTGSTMKMSKEHTAMVAIAKIRETCYGIRVKASFLSESNVSPAHLLPHPKNLAVPLGEDNIGRRLMKLMGWEGGGLGSKGQGTEKPVVAQMHVSRLGLGLSMSSSDIAEFRKKSVNYIKVWMNSESTHDLVFSAEFNIEERKILHNIAQSLSLKSKSYGKGLERQLVISRRSHPVEILRDLLKTGEDSNRYELLYPTNSC